MIDFSKYPRVKRFLEENPGMDLNEAIEWTEKKLEESDRDGQKRTFSK